MIGSRLVELMLKNSYEVTVIDNLWRGKLKYLENIKGFDVEKNFINQDLSVNNPFQILKKGMTFDYIIHLADIVAGIGYVFGNEGYIFNINNKINSNVVKYALDINVDKFIYVGTACSFPKDLQKGINSILRESDLFPADPESAYGWSKLIGSLEMRFLFQDSQIKNTTLMLHNVYGPNCDFSPGKSQVIPSLVYKSLTQPSDESLVVWGSGEQSRAFIHVDDVCDAIIKTLDCDEKLPEFLQIGPDNPITIGDLAKLVIKKSNISRKIEFDITKPTGDFGRGCSSELAKSFLHWKPKIKIENGIQNLVKWMSNELE